MRVLITTQNNPQELGLVERIAAPPLRRPAIPFGGILV
jgi:hypothetical protein